MKIIQDKESLSKGNRFMTGCLRSTTRSKICKTDLLKKILTTNYIRIGSMTTKTSSAGLEDFVVF